MPRIVVPAVFAALLLLPASASAVTVSKAELKGSQLAVEGAGGIGGVFVSVASTTSAAGARPDTSGRFKVAASGFMAPDCNASTTSRPRVATAARCSGR